jgi:hypothetical protein
MMVGEKLMRIAKGSDLVLTKKAALGLGNRVEPISGKETIDLTKSSQGDKEPGKKDLGTNDQGENDGENTPEAAGDPDADEKATSGDT